MTETRYFITGIYIKDKGYALMPHLLSTNIHIDRYIPLNNEMIATLQQENLLPMPACRFDFVTYVFGYFLWIIAAVTILWSLVKSKLLNEDKE